MKGKVNPIPGVVRDRMKYDPESPSGLRYTVTLTGWIKKGQPVGSLGSGRMGRKVWSTKLCGRSYLCSRIVWFLVHGEDVPDGLVLDHIDGNPLNNRIENLRAVTQALNARNRCSAKGHYSTPYIGVSLVGSNGKPRSRYTAYAMVSGKMETRCFSVNKYGQEEALRLAVEWREQKIAELNAQGSGYIFRED